MVDALEAVRRVLRPRGVLVDLQPDESYLPRVAVRGRGRRLTVGLLLRQPDEDVIAANAARERLVAEGRFGLLRFMRHSYRTGFATLAAFEAEVRSHTPPWRLASGVRPRLLAALRASRDDGVIETTRRMTIAVLRKID